MKIIVDTNILVSAIICDNIPEKVVLWIISQPIIEWIASDEIMQEYQGVLQRKKFKLSDETIEKWLRLLSKEITMIESEIKIDFPRDRKDAKFLECAIASGADILITGDKDFSEAQALIETRIMSMSQFNTVFC
jgi:putative PIN family toxin of toxin-antitoxin system